MLCGDGVQVCCVVKVKVRVTMCCVVKVRDEGDVMCGEG